MIFSYKIIRFREILMKIGTKFDEFQQNFDKSLFRKNRKTIVNFSKRFSNKKFQNGAQECIL